MTDLPPQDPVPLTPVSVIIPVLNEEANLPLVLRDLPHALEVVIVDGYSRDRSVEVARRIRPDCRIVMQQGRGKGRAIRAGLAAVSGDFLIFLDADYSHDPAEIVKFVQALRNGHDVVHGSRFLKGAGSADLTPFRWFGNKLFVWLTNRLHGTSYTDVLYGYLGVRKDALARLPLRSTNMEIEVETLIAAHKVGLRVAEVPSFERKRHAGQSRLHALWDGWRIFRRIVRARHMRV